MLRIQRASQIVSQDYIIDQRNIFEGNLDLKPFYLRECRTPQTQLKALHDSYSILFFAFLLPPKKEKRFSPTGLGARARYLSTSQGIKNCVSYRLGRREDLRKQKKGNSAEYVHRLEKKEIRGIYVPKSDRLRRAPAARCLADPTYQLKPTLFFSHNKNMFSRLISRF